jgi:hypothetical protein
MTEGVARQVKGDEDDNPVKHECLCVHGEVIDPCSLCTGSRPGVLYG